MDTENRREGRAEYDPSMLAVNVMTWWLCGYECNARAMSVTSALARARQHLLHGVDVVGITEDMPGFLENMRSIVP